MRLVSITVNRRTRSGHVLGPEQRATVREALHAVTLGAAYQYFEEDVKGSIAPGKQADLVVLERNPLTTDPAELEHIRVLETFSRGRSVFGVGLSPRGCAVGRAMKHSVPARNAQATLGADA